MSLHDSIDRSFDGQLSPAEWEALQEAVIDDPELRRVYVEKRWIHALLEAESDSLPALLEEAQWVRPVSPKRPLAWLAAAAAIVLFGASLVLFAQSRTSPVVATLIEAEGCRWAGSDLPTTEGAGLAAGTLSLMEGMATIRFHSGATVTLEAPTILEVESAMKCRLVEGSVVAEVPESAHGFRIDTAHMEVIDLGTRFGVTTTPLGNSNVFVFEGEVKVKRGESPEAKHLFAGNSLVSDVGAQPDGAQPDGAPDQEVRRSESVPAPGDDWTPISTAIGEGKDSYLRRGDAHGPTGSHPLLMVKHTDLAPNNERRAILTFDLSSVDREHMAGAKLALKVESSGLGFSSLVPDSRFAVYGITHDGAAKWHERDLLWKNGGEFTGEPLSPAFAKRLLSFEIRKGSSNELINSTSDDLVDFLKSQPGSLVTLMLVRETGESDKQGLVHAFASKEHPTSPAPTLWIQNAPAQ